MKYKVGDRVKVYGLRPPSGNRKEPRYSRGDAGTVDGITADDEILVAFDDGSYCEVHPKQCRKIKLRKLSIHKDVWKEWKKKAKGKDQEAGDSSDFIQFVEVKK